MRFGYLDGGKDDEHNGAGFMAISKISVMEDKYFDGTELLDEVCLIKLKQWNH